MADEQLVFAGTYTVRLPFGSRLRRTVRELLSAGRKRSLGVYVLRFDAGTGAVTGIEAAARTDNPSWIAVHPAGGFVYAVNEDDDGGISAFSIDGNSGALHFLNRHSSAGASPCYVTVDGSGRRVYVANYASGTVSMHPIANDGSLQESADVVRHHGSSIHRQRQKTPHPHCVAISPDNGFALVPDLGTDRIMVYRLDPLSGRLDGNDPPFVAVTPGQGPRHLDFHPDGTLAYVVNEMGSTVMSFRFDPVRGTLERFQTVSTLPDGWRGTSTAADLHVHPSGRFLYASNRGHDSIAVFALTPDGGVSRIAVTRSRGRTPRGFTIDPSGRFLLVAHQRSDHLVSFRIDQESGTLAQVWRGKLPTGVCLKFL